jgi:hypothetical protein
MPGTEDIAVQPTPAERVDRLEPSRDAALTVDHPPEAPGVTRPDAWRRFLIVLGRALSAWSA